MSNNHPCPTCGRRAPGRPLATAKHDQRVLGAILCNPQGSWRHIIRASGLSGAHAATARDRLLADGRIEIVAESRGNLGARYRVAPSGNTSE